MRRPPPSAGTNRQVERGFVVGGKAGAPHAGARVVDRSFPARWPWVGVARLLKVEDPGDSPGTIGPGDAVAIRGLRGPEPACECKERAGDQCAGGVVESGRIDSL